MTSGGGAGSAVGRIGKCMPSTSTAWTAASTPPILATGSIQRAGIALASDHGYGGEAAVHHAWYSPWQSRDHRFMPGWLTPREGAGGGWAGVDRGGSASSFPLSTKLESEFSSKDRHGEHKKERQVEEAMIKRRWKEEGGREEERRNSAVGEQRRELSA